MASINATQATLIAAGAANPGEASTAIVAHALTDVNGNVGAYIKSDGTLQVTVGGVDSTLSGYFTREAGILATSVNQCVFIAQEAITVTAIKEIHSTIATSGTLMLEKTSGTTAPGSGTNLMTGTISLAATINTLQTGTLSATPADLKLAIGDRINMVVGGTMTGLVGHFSIQYKRQ